MSVPPKAPKPFLMSEEMLKREFSSALFHSDSGKTVYKQNFVEKGSGPETYILGFLKPLWVILRIAGVFPVAKKEDKYSFSLLTPAFAYSLSVYIVLLFYSAVVLIRLVTLITETAQSFNTLVFSFLCILYSFPQTVVPVIHWFEARRVAGYMNDWTELQRCVELVTGSRFVCTKSCKKVVFVATLILVEVTILVLLECQMLDAILFVETPYYFYTIALVQTHCALWHFLCEALAETSDHLMERLEIEFHSKSTQHVAPVVEKYRTAWCRLTRLTIATGDVMVYTAAFILTLWSGVLLLTIYGSLPGGVDQDYPMSREMGLAIAVAIVFVVIYVFCNSAHQTTDRVGKVFLDRLSFLTSTDKSAQFELDQFAKAVTAKNPVINLGGYVDVNRALLTSLFSSLATYLIVLVQFKMSGSPAPPTTPPVAAPES